MAAYESAKSLPKVVNQLASGIDRIFSEDGNLLGDGKKGSF